jgi:S-adenosylmethionine hydrolase
MKKLIVVADWAGDSLTCQEVRTAVEGFAKNPSAVNISFVAATPSTIHTSYLINQLVETEERYGRPLETVIFQNTDPRIQTTESVAESKGAEFIIVRLATGMYLCGPNAGYDFSLIKGRATDVFHYKDLDKGSQFRSRDLYSRVSAHLMDAMQDELELDEVGVDVIPDLRGYFVGHIDNYGNIKTTIRTEDLKGKHELGETFSVTINNVKKEVKYVNNLFGGTPGELVIYPGSSGKKENPFLEISVWRHFTEEDKTTGLHAFNNPHPGSEITLG